MKTYNQSFLSHYYFISLFFTLFSLTITIFHNKHNEIKILSLLTFVLIVGLFIYAVICSKYIFDGDILLICSGFDKQIINISRIEAISKRKILFTNKYKLLIHPRRYNQIDLYPRQSDLENFINDLKVINPNIIIN